MQIKIDQLLVEKKLARSRTFAQELIREQKVMILKKDEWIYVKKPSLMVESNIEIKIIDSEIMKYVSRAGLKLEGAIKQVNLNLNDLLCLDIGASTGGFTDCLLQHKVQKVVCVDVGQNQLVEQIKNDKRVISIEKINARNLFEYQEFSQIFLPEGFDLVVMDVSFISMTLILDSIHKVLKTEGTLLSLVKPQFELSAECLDKNGIVKNNSLYQLVEDKIKTSLHEKKFNIINYFESSLPGKEGNKEFFVYAKKN